MAQARWPIFVLFLVGTAACGSDLLLPDPPGGGENVVLTKTNGDNQEGTVGEPLPAPLEVQVMTARDLPAEGRHVAFVFTSAAGEVTPDTAITDSEGIANAHWVLGTQPGSQSVTAQLADVEGEPQAASFTAEAKPAAPDTLTATSSRSQPGRRGHEVDNPPVVRVADRFGNPVSGVPVAWTVTTGQGEVSEAITETADDGTSTVKWTLGNRVGIHKLNADIGRITGSPVTFTATVLF